MKNSLNKKLGAVGFVYLVGFLGVVSFQLFSMLGSPSAAQGLIIRLLAVFVPGTVVGYKLRPGVLHAAVAGVLWSFFLMAFINLTHQGLKGAPKNERGTATAEVAEEVRKTNLAFASLLITNAAIAGAGGAVGELAQKKKG